MSARPVLHVSAREWETTLLRGGWYAGLPEALRQTLMEHGTARRFPRGAWIYLQGDPPRGLWAVLEGELAFSKIGGAGSEVIYHVGGPGMWFGVVGAVTGIALGITVTAVRGAFMLRVPL